MSVINQEITDKILLITLNRPDKLNALNEEVLTGLSNIFDNVKNNNKIKGLLITGSGRAFCAGADINKLAECDASSGYKFAKFGQEVFAKLANLGKPSIAAVNGFAFGGGCELAISASIRMASDVAKFGQPEVKLGVIPGYGGTQRLARLVGKGRALDLCLSGRFIDASTAEDWGLVTAVLPSEELIPKAMQMLKEITSLAPLALQSVIESIEHGYDLSLCDALHLEAVQFAATCATRDKNEGVSAFLEKRTPNFVGE
ncbi:MAG: enoyl-CoA hydratase [Legionellales bacterium RIFCSPHIGHO2_12_FULL_35_11]|nr:MAG: enoyl-CoA hydratase [Legionellales bacterium RIFCSPHIGHO2_12_FULL_35_11]